MPFDRKSLELDADAAKVVIEFVKGEHSERFEEFLTNTGRTAEEWKKTVSISHDYFLGLQELVYKIWGQRDPWRFVEIGNYLTSIEDSPAVMSAKKLGSTAAVVALCGVKPNKELNIDSVITPLSVRVEKETGKEGNVRLVGRAQIKHDNLGYDEFKYLTAPTTSAGYLRGIPNMWRFDPMKVDIRMLDQRLEAIINNEFPGIEIGLTKDSDGNFMDENERIVAQRKKFSDTIYRNVETQGVYRIINDRRLFVGNPGVHLKLRKGEYEEVDLEDLEMHYVPEDIFRNDQNGNRILIAKGDTYFGGPFTVYDLEWEDKPLNWLSKLVLNVSEWYRGIKSGGVWRGIAREEERRRDEKEKENEKLKIQAEQLRSQMTILTRERMYALDEKEELKGRTYGWLHDSKHEFANVYSQALSFIIPLLEIAEFFSGDQKIYESLGREEIKSAKDIKRYYGSEGNEIVLDTLDLFEVYSRLKEVAEKRKESEGREGQFFGWIVNSFDITLEDLIQLGESGAEHIQDRLDSVKGDLQVRIVDYAKLVRDTVKSSIELVYPSVDIKVELPQELLIKGNIDDLRVVAYNTLDNSCEAAKESGGKVRIYFNEDEGGWDIITENTGVITNENLEKLNLIGRGDRFSTKRGDQGGYGTMAISRILNSYGGGSSYSKGENIVMHTARIPSHRISKN